MKAKLITSQMEIGSPRKTRSHGFQPSYRWVECYKVIDPQGREMQPYMRKREAVKFCKLNKWEYEIVK